MEPLLSDYITREEFATELRITTRTADKWAWLRKGPPRVRIGARTYYSRAAVAAWLAEQARAPAKDAA